MTIVDKYKDEAVGTIELFNRNADDFFTECGLLRLDIRSDYEQSEAIERIRALEDMGFSQTNEKINKFQFSKTDSYCNKNIILGQV